MANNQPVELVIRHNDESAVEDDFTPVSLTEPLPVVTMNGRSYGRYFGQGAGNTAFTLAVPAADRARQISYALAGYSAAPTQAGVTFVLTPANGAAYAVTLSTGTANAQNNSYIPDTPLILLPGDKLSITAPAGGSGIFAYCTVAWEWVS